MYTLAEAILKKNGMDFKLLLPLIEETTGKLKKMSPKDAQTGPAIRKDKSTLKKHLKMLKGDKKLKNMYKLISGSIAI
jgi:hypothetical protein